MRRRRIDLNAGAADEERKAIAFDLVKARRFYSCYVAQHAGQSEARRATLIVAPK